MISGVVGFALLPVMQRGLGNEAYGLWIAVLAISNISRQLEFGLSWAVIRCVAAFPHAPETIEFVRSTIRALLVIGGLAALGIAAFGPFAGAALGLSRPLCRTVWLVFASGGIMLLGDQVLSIATAVATGLRRFDLVNLLSVGSLLVRAAGITWICLTIRSVVALSVWVGACSLGAGVVGAWMVTRMAPQYAYRGGTWSWRSIAHHLAFGSVSQAALASSKVMWEAGPLVIGFMLGSAHVVPYYIGQKFPFAVSTLGWRAADVLFPAVSEKGGNIPARRGILELGTRMAMLVVLPLGVVLCAGAHRLIPAWVAVVPSGTLAVFYASMVAVGFDAIAAASIQTLWASGRVRSVLVANISMLAVSVLLGAWLLHVFGIAGGALALAAASAVGSLALIHIAARSASTAGGRLLRSASRGLFLPLAASAAATFLLVGHSLPGVLFVMFAGWLVFSGLFMVSGSRPDEVELARQMFSLSREMLARVRRFFSRTQARRFNGRPRPGA